jgi:CRP/FNR family transcriptional activator FtrB
MTIQSQSPSQTVLPMMMAIPLFARFAIPDLQVLLERSEILAPPTGAALFGNGDYLAFLYVVLEGEFELTVLVDDQPCVFEICRQGAILGEAAVFSGDPSALSAKALVPSTVLAIPAADLLALLESRFDLQRHVLSVQSQRLRSQVKKIAELKLKTTAQRLGIYLLSLTNQANGHFLLDLPHDKKRIAEELGMQPESLSRSLGKLSRAGVESLPNNRIEIADLSALRQFCIADD